MNKDNEEDATQLYACACIHINIHRRSNISICVRVCVPCTDRLGYVGMR